MTNSFGNRESTTIHGVIQRDADGNDYVVLFNAVQVFDPETKLPYTDLQPIGVVAVRDFEEDNLQALKPRLKAWERAEIRKQTKAAHDAAKRFLQGSKMDSRGRVPYAHLLDQHEYESMRLLAEAPFDAIYEAELDRREQQLFTELISARTGKKIRMQWGNIRTVAAFVHGQMAQHGGKFLVRPTEDKPTDTVPEVTMDE
jgi:hypothetical protein